MTNYMGIVSFLHALFTETMKVHVVEFVFKKAYGETFVVERHNKGFTRLEKYLNFEGLLEKSLKIKSALKSAGKLLRVLEKSLNCTIFCRTQHC